jgi:hypothetical protein
MRLPEVSERPLALDPALPVVDQLPLLDERLHLGTRERVEPPTDGAPVEREAVVLAGADVVVIHARQHPGPAIHFVDEDLARLPLVERDDIDSLAAEREVVADVDVARLRDGDRLQPVALEVVDEQAARLLVGHDHRAPGKLLRVQPEAHVVLVPAVVVDERHNRGDDVHGAGGAWDERNRQQQARREQPRHRTGHHTSSGRGAARGS